MKYIALTRNDFDRFFRYENQYFFCYSARMARKLSHNGRFDVVGLTRQYNSGDEYVMELGESTMSIIAPERNNPRYKTIGYIPVEGYYSDCEYIAVQKRLGHVASFFAVMFDNIRHHHTDKTPAMAA